MNQDTEHLSDEQITWAIIDQGELSGSARKHLARCDRCSGKVEAIKRSLARIGDQASRLVPPPRPRPIIDRKETNLSLLDVIFGLRKLGFSMALAGILLVIIGGGLLVQEHSHNRRLAAVREGVLSDAALMAEVDQLIENPLPPLYNDLVGEESLATDRDFIDFVVPDGSPGEDHAGSA